MYSEHICVADCKVGDIIAKDIESPYGVKLVAKDSAVTDYIRNKLMEFDIKYVYIYKNETEDTKIKEAYYKEIEDRVKKNIYLLKSVLNDLSAGKPLNLKYVEDMSESIHSIVGKNEFIVRYLNDIRNADEYTYTHSIDVAFYSMLLARWMGLSEYEVGDIIKAALLHDIGKIKVPFDILNKTGQLTPEEYSEMKKHSQYGYDIVKGYLNLDKKIKDAILMHHERINGSGYPFGYKADEICIYAKILSVADVFDAMTTDRIYRKRVTPFETFKMFITGGVVLFDPKILRVFLENIAPYYTGVKVLLDNGTIGEIAYVPPNDLANPIINVDSHYIDTSKTKVKVLCVV